jgi:hypothetical protein
LRLASSLTLSVSPMRAAMRSTAEPIRRRTGDANRCSASQAYPFFTMSRAPLVRPTELGIFNRWTTAYRSGGARRDRTDDLLLAKQALSQLSYGPVSTLRPPSRQTIFIEDLAHTSSHQGMVGLERFELSTSRLSSARSNQLSYRPAKRGRRPNEERETKAAAPRMHSKDHFDS